MSKKEGGENITTTPENESSVNSDPLKGYLWKDGEQIHLKDGATLSLIKNGKDFGFTYIDADGTYFPDLSQPGGILGPEDKNSPFLLFGNTIMEAGTEIPEKNEEVVKIETEPEAKIKISPAVKNIAEAGGLTEEDLQKITGTGKNGNLTKKDIENYLKKNSTPDEEKVGEWKEVADDTRVTIFEEGEISIKKGSEFYISEFKYVVTSIKEREVGKDEAEYDIECDVIGLNTKENFKSTMDIGELEEVIEEVYISLEKNKEKLRKSLFTPPKTEPGNKKSEKTKKQSQVVKPAISKNIPPKREGLSTEKEIKINGFVFVAGKTTFKIDGDLFRIDEIRKMGDNRLEWELTVSKINPITKEVIQQKEKSASWLNEIIKDFASNSEINLKEKEGKNSAVDLATKEKRELSEALEKLKNKKTKKGNTTNPVVASVKTEDEGVAQQEKVEEVNELADFFSNNLSSSFLKPRTVNKKEAVVKTEQKKTENKIPEKNREWAPNRAAGINEIVSENKNESILEQKAVAENQTVLETNENKNDGLSLKEIIEREKPRTDQIYSENLQKNKKEKTGNKWRNAWGWALGLLGLGATAYGVKEYSEKNPNDKSLENESKYQYNLEKEPEGFYYENKKDSSKQKVEEKRTESAPEKKGKKERKNEKIKSTVAADTTKQAETVENASLKVDSIKAGTEEIKSLEAPKFLAEAVSIYHPELTTEEKNIVGNSYSKVLEYISGEEDVEAFYKNLSWLNTMGWSIDSTLNVSKKVLAGEYGEVGETEKRMAEYFVNFAKRQEEKGLPANGMNTEAYIISGLIKDAGIKKE